MIFGYEEKELNDAEDALVAWIKSQDIDPSMVVLVICSLLNRMSSNRRYDQEFLRLIMINISAVTEGIVNRM